MWRLHLSPTSRETACAVGAGRCAICRCPFVIHGYGCAVQPCHRPDNVTGRVEVGAVLLTKPYCDVLKGPRES